jgi:hypothetical protein
VVGDKAEAKGRPPVIVMHSSVVEIDQWPGQRGEAPTDRLSYSPAGLLTLAPIDCQRPNEPHGML